MFENFICSYGYYAIFLFACIEGEVAILTAGFLCKQGLLSIKLVVLFAFLGTLITEQTLFFVGRKYGVRLLEKYPTLFKKSAKIMEFLKKYNAIFIFGSRFIYGIRNISPVMIGIAGISPSKFSSLNVPAALIWSIVVAGAGYTFANLLDVAEAHLKYFQQGALAVVVIALLIFLYKKTPMLSKKNKKKHEKKL